MKRICVYCGSSPGEGNDYIKAAEGLAQELVTRNLGLVYGGASVGVMGAIANAVMQRGGEVIGIIPEALMRKEIGNDHLTELHVVGSMHERKAAMAEASDGFIALPGGMGTLEEIFEILTWAQLGFHHKPCALLNVNGYYDHLIAFLDHQTEQGFTKQVMRDMAQIASSPLDMIRQFENYTPPSAPKWINRDET